ncbi:hypothetical protein JCM11641_005126, partial [Rhodosporidiobolus odoratus]
TASGSKERPKAVQGGGGFRYPSDDVRDKGEATIEDCAQHGHLRRVRELDAAQDDWGQRGWWWPHLGGEEEHDDGLDWLKVGPMGR